MPRVLFFHGLGGGPNPLKVSTLRSTFGEENVHAVKFPFSRENLQRLIYPIPSLMKIKAEVVRMGAESRRIAREACDQHRPDVLVGSSLGATLAIRLAVEHQLPTVLLTPVWNTEVKSEFIQRNMASWLPATTKYEHLIPVFGPLLIFGFLRFAGFQRCDQVQPRTVILHSPKDELYDLRHSVRLLANSPLTPGDVDTAFMNSVTDSLVERGYATEGRLVKIGIDHQMDDLEARRGLIDAINLLSGRQLTEKHGWT